MLKLHVFGSYFGVPDPSPFAMKALVLMKMSGLDFKTGFVNFRKAPKGKGPYLADEDEIIPDSTFIRFHLEDKYGIDFDPGLNDEQKAIAWAFEKLCEDNIYFAVLYERWQLDDNFDKGPARFFDRAPALLRPLIKRQVRKAVVKGNLYGQGMGRHSQEEVERITEISVKSLSVFLGDKPYLMGNEPCGADAAVFAHVANGLCPHFDGFTLRIAQKYPNLRAYNDRCMARWFPEFV